MSLHNVFEDIPNDWFATVNDFLGALYSLYNTTLYELTYDERLVKFGGHQFRQTALAHFEFRTYNNY